MYAEIGQENLYLDPLEITNSDLLINKLDEKENLGIVLGEKVVAISISSENYPKEKVLRFTQNILAKSPANFVVVDDDRNTLFYKTDKNIDAYIDVVTACGIHATVLTSNFIIPFKIGGVVKQHIGEPDFSKLTELPDILCPVNDYRVADLGMISESSKYKKLCDHLYIIKNKLKFIKINEIVEFINISIFDFPLGQSTINKIINKICSYKSSNSKSNKVFKTLDLFDEKLTEWLYYPYIPLGAITILAGDPGSGKSHLSVKLASIISNGEKFPFTYDIDTALEPSMVIMQNGEDDIEQVIKPRLTKAGANHKNVGVIVEDEELFSLNDLEKLERVLEYKKPKLIIIDPVQRYMGDINLNSITEVTNCLKGVNALAQKYACAILIVMHLNKGDGKGLYRLNGSVGLPGIARSVLLISDVKSEENCKALVHIKSNLAKAGLPTLFEITDKGVNFIAQITNEELSSMNKSDSKPSQKEVAINFILDVLKNGPVESQFIIDLALEKQIAKPTLERAKKELGVKSYQKDSKWYWILKDEDKLSDTHEVSKKSWVSDNLKKENEEHEEVKISKT